MTSDVSSPVAILDKEIGRYPSYTIEMFELCDCCGARFGIGYHQTCKNHGNFRQESAGVPNRLREMLAEDHGHDRKHKHFTEIWVFSNWNALDD